MLDACYEAPVIVTGNVRHLPFLPLSHSTRFKSQVANILYHPRPDILPPNYFQLLLYLLVCCKSSSRLGFPYT